MMRSRISGVKRGISIFSPSNLVSHRRVPPIFGQIPPQPAWFFCPSFVLTSIKIHLSMVTFNKNKKIPAVFGNFIFWQEWRL